MFGGGGKIMKVILGNFTREQNGFWIRKIKEELFESKH